MTEEFLEALLAEPGLDSARLYLNGGANGSVEAGWQVCTNAQRDGRVRLHDALGWPFYRMWNRGITHAQSFTDVALVLNNDIRWPEGALLEMATQLDKAPPEVVAIVPNLTKPIAEGIQVGPPQPAQTFGHRELTCCWAVRTDIFECVPPIDESYACWFGDAELAANIERFGMRVERLPGVPVEHRVEATMRYLPDVEAKREADRRLFELKWG